MFGRADNFEFLKHTEHVKQRKYKQTPLGSLLGCEAPLYAHVRTVGVNLNWLVLVIRRTKLLRGECLSSRGNVIPIIKGCPMGGGGGGHQIVT